MNELALILGIIGLCVGAWLFGFHGAVSGGVLGFLLGSVIDLRDRVRKLEQERDTRQQASSVKSFEMPGKPEQPYPEPVHAKPYAYDSFKDLKNETEPEAYAESGDEPHNEPENESENEAGNLGAAAFAGIPEANETRIPDAFFVAAKDESVSDIKPDPEKTPPSEGNISKLIGYIRAFFTTGNVVVKVGIIILFFGIAFLLKYAADHSILPIEVRLCGVAAAGIGLLVFGWKMRLEKRGFGLSLQGGGIGILYLTVFSAVKLYALIPPFLAMSLMISFVILSGFIAVIQDAKALAVLASAGGFLAPVLVSSGGGSHVTLFLYYLLLNAGVLGIAWFKSWRELNLTGFAFTFVISAIWGINYYIPENFATTEPFLLLFFIMYALISVLFAFRQPPNLKGYVDGALVFGLPLVAFGLQSGLVRQFEYGIAISSLCLALFYVLLAIWLWSRKVEQIRMLTEAFLAIGIVFATLAIPFAFDRQWIAASWGLEGASMVWIGLRQKRCLARSFGLLLQICAGFTLITGFHHYYGYNPGDEWFVLNARCFNNIIMALAGLFSGFFYNYYSDRLYKWERWFHGIAGLWGTLWWFGGGLSEIDRHITYQNKTSARLIFIALSSGFFKILRRPLDWVFLALPPVILMPWMFFVLLADLFKGITHPFSGYGLIAWVSAFVSHFYVLHVLDTDWKQRFAYFWHTSGFVILVIVASWEVAWLADYLIKGSDVWKLAGWLGVPGITILFLIKFGENDEWPKEQFRKAYFSSGCCLIASMLGIFFLWACHNDGNPSPLSYFPVLNPADILQLFVVIVLLVWSRAITVERMPVPSFPLFRPGGLIFFSAAAAFILLNVIVARCVHVWGDVYYSFHNLTASFVFQASISILWTFSALCIMPLASRKGIRKLWFVGAWLLCAVVIKLFFVDLGGRGTGERIISFIAVGVLMLVIGFLSPLPPSVDSVEDSGSSSVN